MTRPDLDELLRLAEHVARAAGELLRTGRPEHLAVDTKSSPTDAVTEMDRAAEALLVEALLAARPDDGVLGEEGTDRPGSSGVRWVVDPLDGTVNYLYGIPHYTVAVAAEVDGVVEVGVVHDPSADETYSAVRGRGASVDGRALRVTEVGDLSQAMVGTGFGYGAERRARQGTVLASVLPRVRDIRRSGSAAYDLCSLARGRLDAYYEQGLHPWDLAAAGLVAAEAGARVEGLHGRPASYRLVVATHPGLFPALHDLLAALDADADPQGAG